MFHFDDVIYDIECFQYFYELLIDLIAQKPTESFGLLFRFVTIIFDRMKLSVSHSKLIWINKITIQTYFVYLQFIASSRKSRI